jgi:hypothetical protein
MKKGKESVLMLFIIVLICISVPINIWKVYPHVHAEMKKGDNIWKFKSICPTKTVFDVLMEN